MTFRCGDNGTGEMGIFLHQSPHVPSDFHRSLRGIPSVFCYSSESVLISHTLDIPEQKPRNMSGLAWCGGCRVYALHMYCMGVCMLSSPHSRFCSPRGCHDVCPWHPDGSFSVIACYKLSMDEIITFLDGCFRLLIPLVPRRMKVAILAIPRP